MNTTQVRHVLYKPKNNVTWDAYEILDFIQGLLDIIEKNKEYFLVIAKILEKYKAPDDDTAVAEYRNKELQDTVILYSQIKDNKGDTALLINLLNQLYSRSSQEIGDIRGKVLEAVIYKYGPKNFNLSDKTIKCLEAIISYESEENILGVNGSDFDFAFHDSDGNIDAIADYFECKATLDESVNIGQPMSSLRPRKLKKWDYAKSIFQQLELEGLKPNIYFACLNIYTEDIQSHINNNGYDCVEILNAQKIFRMLWK